MLQILSRLDEVLNTDDETHFKSYTITKDEAGRECAQIRFQHMSQEDYKMLLSFFSSFFVEHPLYDFELLNTKGANGRLNIWNMLEEEYEYCEGRR